MNKFSLCLLAAIMPLLVSFGAPPQPAPAVAQSAPAEAAENEVDEAGTADKDAPRSVKAISDSCVMIQTERGYQTGFFYEGDRVWSQLTPLAGVSELAVVIPYIHDSDGEIYERHYEALILFTDTVRDIAILELVAPPGKVQTLKNRSDNDLPDEAWGMPLTQLKDIEPMTILPFKGRPVATETGFTTTLRSRAWAQGAPLVDSKGRVVGMLQANEDARFLHGARLPSPKDIETTANRYRDRQPSLLKSDYREAARLRAKLAAVYQKLAPSLAAVDLSRSHTILQTEMAARGNQRIMESLRGWSTRIDRASLLWNQIVTAITNGNKLQLPMFETKLTVLDVKEGAIRLVTDIPAANLSTEELTAIVEQVPPWNEATAEARAAEVENFALLCFKDSALFADLQSQSTDGALGGIEIADEEWDTFLGNPQHNPAFAGSTNGELELRWAIDEKFPTRIAADREAIYAMIGERFGQGVLKKYSIGTGAFIKEYELGKVPTVNPPGLAGRYILLQKADHSKTKLLCLDKRTFKLCWTADCPEQWEHHEHPTTYKGMVFVNGGSNGGWFAFDLKTGNKLWFGQLPQYDGWTPCLYRDVAYSAVGGVLTARDPVTGTDLWTSKAQNEWKGWTAAGAVVATGNRLYITAGNSGLQVFDLSKRAFVWSQKGTLPPVIGGNLVICPEANILHAYTLDGKPKWAWDAGAPIVCTPIMFGSKIAVSTAARTVVLDARTAEVRSQIPVGGDLALVNRDLLIRGNLLSCYRFK